MSNLCKIRDIQRSVIAFEQDFIKCYGICLNEGMALCSINNSPDKELTSGELSEFLSLSASNTSKIISSMENKKLLKRTLGQKDKRQMYFSLTNQGKEMLSNIISDDIPIPELLNKLID